MPFLPSKLGNNLKPMEAQDFGKCRSWGALYQKGPIGRRNFFISASDSLWLYQSSSNNTLHLPEHVPHNTPHMSNSIPARTNVKAVCYSSSSSLIISKLWTVTDCRGESYQHRQGDRICWSWYTAHRDSVQGISKGGKAEGIAGTSSYKDQQIPQTDCNCMKLFCKRKYKQNRSYLQFHSSHWNAAYIFRRLRKRGIIYVYLEDIVKARREGRKILFCHFWDQARGFAK